MGADPPPLSPAARYAAGDLGAQSDPAASLSSVFGAREVGVDQPDWMMGATNLTDTIQIPINGMIVMVLTALITVLVSIC